MVFRRLMFSHGVSVPDNIQAKFGEAKFGDAKFGEPKFGKLNLDAKFGDAKFGEGQVGEAQHQRLHLRQHQRPTTYDQRPTAVQHVWPARAL